MHAKGILCLPARMFCLGDGESRGKIIEIVRTKKIKKIFQLVKRRKKKSHFMGKADRPLDQSNRGSIGRI